MRSWLFVPGDSRRKLDKALSCGTDCLIVDLEDSVPLAQKSAARALARNFLLAARSNGETPRPGLVARVNPFDSNLTDDDLAAVVGARPDGILLPKCVGGADVQRLSAMIAVHEAEAGIPQGATTVHALIAETARGVLAAGTFSEPPARLGSLSWGSEDLAADLGAQANRDAAGRYTDVFRHARAMTLLAAAGANVAAVDTVYVNFRDSSGLERECRAAARDGFSGKMAIHPGQVPVINAAFTPSAAAVDRARRIVELFERAGETAGVLSLDGQMIDRPHLCQAQEILARAAQPVMSASRHRPPTRAGSFRKSGSRR